jgi:lysophospholipase L1-like esterase
MRYLVLALALLVGCGDGSDNDGLPKVCEYSIDLKFIGDSNTSTYSYAEIIGEAYYAEDVRNIAVGGTSTQDWRPGGRFMQREPVARVTSIMLGTADAFELRSDDEYIANVDAIVDTLLRYGSCRIVLVPPPLMFNDGDDFIEPNHRLRHYGRLLGEYADAEDFVDLGPDLQALLGPEHFIWDGIHINVHGHALIADALGPMLEPLN